MRASVKRTLVAVWTQWWTLLPSLLQSVLVFKGDSSMYLFCLVVLHILNKRKTKHEEYLNHLCPANETFNHCAVEFPPTASDIYRWVRYSVQYPRRTPQGTQPWAHRFPLRSYSKQGCFRFYPISEKSSLTPPLKRGNNAFPLITLTHAHTHKPLTDFFFTFFYSRGLLLRQNYAAHFTCAKVCKENVKGLWLQLACKTTTRSGFYFWKFGLKIVPNMLHISVNKI